MEKSGMLSLIKVYDKDSELYLEFLRKSNNTPAFDFINYMIGKDYIQFLDLLAGSVLKVPSRKSLYRDIEYVKIYVYVRDNGFTVETIRCAAKLFNKKLAFVRRAVMRVSKVINGVEVDIVCPDCGEENLLEDIIADIELIEEEAYLEDNDLEEGYFGETLLEDEDD